MPADGSSTEVPAVESDQLHHEGVPCGGPHRQIEGVGIDAAATVRDGTLDSKTGVIDGEGVQTRAGASLEEGHPWIGKQGVLHLRKGGADKGKRPQLSAGYVLQCGGELPHLHRISRLEFIDGHEQPGALLSHMVGGFGQSGADEGRQVGGRGIIALHRRADAEHLHREKPQLRSVISEVVRKYGRQLVVDSAR